MQNISGSKSFGKFVLIVGIGNAIYIFPSLFQDLIIECRQRMRMGWCRIPKELFLWDPLTSSTIPSHIM